MISWSPYKDDVHNNYYISFFRGYSIYKKVGKGTATITVYSFSIDALVWFTSEQQIIKFLTV